MDKGTVNIRGKEYITVAKRVHDFRQNHSIADGWRIITHLVTCNEDIVVMRAEILQPAGDVVATGWAEEVRSTRGINQNAALENCETSAIGRALAAAGFGGSQYASADELAAKLAGKATVKKAEDIVAPDDYKQFRQGISDRMLGMQAVINACKAKQWGNPRTWAPVKRARFLAAIDAGNIDGLS